MLNSLKWKCIAVCVSSLKTHIGTTSPCLLTADNAAQCSGNSRLLFQVPSERLSPSSPLLPSTSVGRWWVVMCCLLGEGFLFSLKPQALFGNWLVCMRVCVVHNGYVYNGFGVHMFIHACTFICTCRLCFLLSRERGVGFLSLGTPNRYRFYKVVACCFSTHLGW